MTNFLFVWGDLGGFAWNELGMEIWGGGDDDMLVDLEGYGKR